MYTTVSLLCIINVSSMWNVLDICCFGLGEGNELGEPYMMY